MSRPPTDIRSVLFVCLGNICRSPMAEGVMRAQAEQHRLPLLVDSAGTADYHQGQSADARARRVAMECGTPIDELRARRIEARDFDSFDLILAADASVLRELQLKRPAQAHAELAPMLEWAGLGAGVEVPDPYFGRIEHFREVYELLQRACRGITARLRGVAECEPMHAFDDRRSPW